MSNGASPGSASLLPVLIGGAVGGMFPNLIRLSVGLIDGGKLPPPSYVIGLVLFGLLGGAVAFIWRETDLKKAFFLGIGMPSLIQVGSFESQKTDQDQPGSDQTYIIQETGYALETNWPRVFDIILPALHAEEPHLPNWMAEEKPTPVPNRKLIITSATPLPPYTVLFLSAKGTYQKKVLVDHAKPDTLYPRRDTIDAVIEVPDFASQFTIRVKDSNVLREDLTPVADDTLTVNLEVINKVWSGFLKSVGLTESKSKEIILKQKASKKVP